MHVVQKDDRNPGKFMYELWKGFEKIETGRNFKTKADAERAAQAANRLMLFCPNFVASGDFEEMPLDDILGELEI